MKRGQSQEKDGALRAGEHVFQVEDLPSLRLADETVDFDARLDTVPDEAGVYLMLNADEKVIYVGKALRLRQRLRSYFAKTPRGSAKVLAMISHIHDFKYLICQNEVEALILESNLIKRYQPFYNILLKDDHDYPYMRITMQEAYPRIMKAYRIGDDVDAGCRYYGPYLNSDLNKALRSIHEIFPLKTCRRQFPRDIGKERPCIEYYIGHCIGPCRGDVPAQAYREVCQRVCDFLEGRYDGIIDSLKSDMKAAAAALDFESAARYRDRLQSFEKLFERQIAVLDRKLDADILAFAKNDLELCLLKLELRAGKISGTATYFFPNDETPEAELLRAFLLQYYPRAAELPAEIEVEYLPTELEACEAFLKSIAGKSVRIHRPERGDKKALLDMARRNAGESLKRRALAFGKQRNDRRLALDRLSEFLQLDERPQRIEAYDIANLGQDAMVCAMVVYEDGKLASQDCRLFRIKGQEGQDDYQAMAEAISRRLQHLEDEDWRFGARPDLLLLDGGRGHVSSIMALLQNRGFGTIPCAGMVKDRRHRSRGLVRGDGEILELAARLGLLRGAEASKNLDQEPELGLGLIPEKNEERDRDFALLRFITAIQNEVHRQANRYHQLLRKKKTLKFSLEAIPGIGPARRKLLMNAFGSIKAISEASESAIAVACPKLSEKQIAAVYAHFHPTDDPEESELEALLRGEEIEA
ncbi:MAG: excinuclease ABC subunit UvrC [Eubacteriales bacterium]|nr:excinuclease ABC subunit UvrC [Eubacteriales bacterium]